MQVLAIDPGREKCGVALARLDPGAPEPVQVLERAIWPRGKFLESLRGLLDSQVVEAFVLGDATTSQQMKQELASAYPDIAVRTVDERNSTLEARALYWKAHPPRGWRRLAPLSLQEPPRPIDDFAAEVLATRFAQALQLEWPAEPDA